MQRKYCVLALVVIFLCTAPVAASLTQIAPGATVYLGENNLDISHALTGCHTIAWWKNGTDTSAPPAKNITLVDARSMSETLPEIIYHYNISPGIFSSYKGKWYCEDTKPLFVVFEVVEPTFTLSVWDLDHNEDVSGKSVPVSTNITYRIDTNMFLALKPLYRPDVTPSDSFFTVSLTNPLGEPVGNIYSGSYGNKNTQIYSFDNRPFITASPYYWKNGKDWDRNARSKIGEPLYPPGTYTFSVSQNLNNMKDSYKDRNSTGSVGKINQTATVTFLKMNTSAVPLTSTPSSTQPLITTQPVTTNEISYTPAETELPTSLPVPVKTTYSPLPAWIALLGIVVAGLFVIPKKR